MNLVCTLQRIPRAITKVLNAIDRGASSAMNAAGGGFGVCQHTFGDWSEPVEKRAHKVGAFKIIKRDAILLSTSKHRTCTKCKHKQTHTIAAGQ